ncbi:MAG: AI-2E family transporter [Acidimicrobiia bacterium]|nr:AI-2E family transporter [Acidimicrobiia bacterium]
MVDFTATERVRRIALIIWATIGALVVVAAVMWVASQVRIIWLPLVFAAGLVVLLDPIVRALERIAVPRVLGVLFGFLVVAAILAAIGVLVVPAVRTQAADFGSALPGLYDQTVAWLRDVGDQFGLDLGPVWTSETIREWIQDPANQSALQELIGGFGSGAGKLLRGITETVAVVGLAPILAFYLLVDLPRSRRLFLELTPPSIRDEVAYVSKQVGAALGAFVRGQLLVAFVVGTLSAVALWFFDLPFWLIIGIATGLLNLIPFVGPFFGAVLAATVALVEGRPGVAVIIVVVFTLIQQIDNHIITPMIQRARVRLSPLVIVIALLAGGSIAGLLGVLVAVPTVTVLRILLGHMWRTRVLGESWVEATEKMIETTEPSERLLAVQQRRRAAQDRLFDTAELGPSEADSIPVPSPSDGL